MLCHQTQALSKRGNLEQHHNTNHYKFKDSFSSKSAIQTKKVTELKARLKAQQLLFNGFKNKGDIKTALRSV